MGLGRDRVIRDRAGVIDAQDTLRRMACSGLDRAGRDEEQSLQGQHVGERNRESGPCPACRECLARHDRTLIRRAWAVNSIKNGPVGLKDP
jgi:hypothetical protein